MRTLIFCLSFLFVTGSLYAQRSISAAKIVTENNGTLDVYIRNGTYEGTPQQFEYSLKEGGPYVNISVDDIKSVKFDDGRFYEKHNIAVAVIRSDYISRSLFDYKDEKNKFKGPALIEKIIDAPVSLYQFEDKFSHSHFFYTVTDGNTIVPLENMSYGVEGGVFYKDERYKSTLSTLMQEKGCASAVLKSATTVDYRLQDLTKAFQAINICAGGQVTADPFTKRNKTTFAVSLIGGVSLSKLRAFKGDFESFPGVQGNVFGNSLAPVFGVSLDILPGKAVKNYIGSIEVMHQTYINTTDSISGGYYKGTATIKQKMVNLNPLIKLFLGKRNVVPFLEGGGNLNFVYSSDLKATYLNILTSTIGKNSTDNESTDFNIGVLAGGGVELKKLSIHSRYCFNGSYSNVFLIAKYRFF